MLVLFADTPLIAPETLARMAQARAGADDPAVVVLGPADGYYYNLVVSNKMTHHTLPDNTLQKF